MIVRFQQRRLRPLAHVIHGLLVMTWLLSSNSVTSFVLITMAAMDHSHVATVGTTAEGEYNVILSHEATDGGRGKDHVHEGVGLLLTALALYNDPDTSDHVLSLGEAAEVRRSMRRFIFEVKDWHLPSLVFCPPMEFVTLTPRKCLDRRMAPERSWAYAMKTRKTVLRC